MEVYELKNSLELKGDWNIFKGKIKQKLGRLTDNSEEYTRGLEDEVIGRIQKQTGEARRALEHLLRARDQKRS